ncbi:transketolase [Kwoniella dejecticola CBS 10117]|uniref:transketolase n=1 Tax=Kwoniella dejecticola CBS 10117 TaxID=1296121 RepID=A0A1A5ZZW0_9TREE|nr:transketolase [Kwoniella dejecticola CBS 10117]OBR83360.1 transketolase [Kwoniella dejecticola CBS 10117]
MSPIATQQVNSSHGTELSKNPHVLAKASSPDTEKLVINTIRCLGADLCQQYKGGHPGTVMGAAAIATALWKYSMRYNPANPDWVNRDRFVLSAGHACLLQYILLHLSGYSTWTLDQIKKYHAPTMDGIAAGHPEIEFPGVELTTGLLGQGIANAVGLAIANKNMAATYNKDGFPVIDNKVWCFTGDGCLQEGIGQEAISMAGHWGLDNLILVYDNNSVTVDGSIDICFTDDTSAKLKSMGWHVLEVDDGSNDLAAIVEAFDKAKTFTGKPTFINIKTVIGIGSANQGSGKVHGAALGEDDVKNVKSALGFNPEEKFVVPQSVYDYFSETKSRGQKDENEWNQLVAKYQEAYPKESAELHRRLKGELIEGWEGKLPPKESLPKDPKATRQSSGIFLKSIIPEDNSFLVGSADLCESTFVNWDNMVEFQNPKSGYGDYSGRQVRYGIREHAMVAAANGVAAWHKGAFVPIMSSYFIFWLYAAPSLRMAALMKLRFIAIATHDSIGVGEDGPTHQPIAFPTFLRALPNLNYVRPADAEEVAGAWILALKDEDHPSFFSLTRQPVPLLEGTDRNKVQYGAYIVHGDANEIPDLTLIATGSEVGRAIDTAKLLKDYKVRVVSMPHMGRFDKQSVEYRRSTIPSGKSLVVAIEPYCSFGWAKYAHAGAHMTGFGHSAPYSVLFEHFGFGPKNLASKISAWAETRKTSQGWDLPGVGEFEELLLNQNPAH